MGFGALCIQWSFLFELSLWLWASWVVLAVGWLGPSCSLGLDVGLSSGWPLFLALPDLSILLWELVKLSLLLFLCLYPDLCWPFFRVTFFLPVSVSGPVTWPLLGTPACPSVSISPGPAPHPAPS